MRLADFCQHPTPIELAGASYLASELRVRDVADLERFIAQTCEDGAREHESIAQLRDFSIEAGRRWPPPLGSEFGSRTVMTTERGQALMLLLSLRATEEIKAKECESLVKEMAPGELAALYRIAFGLTGSSLEEDGEQLFRYLGFEQFPNAGASKLDRAVEELARASRLGFDQIREMTLSQVRHARALWWTPAGMPDAIFGPKPATETGGETSASWRSLWPDARGSDGASAA